MIVSRVHPGPVESLDLNDPDARPTLLAWYRPARPEWLRLNLVTSLNGSVVGPDGTSESLTIPTDRRILGVIRELSELVLVGAATVRAEGYVLPRRATLAVVTSSGHLGGHRLSAEDLARVVVMCPASAIGQVRASLGAVRTLTVPDSAGRVDLRLAVQRLHAEGFSSIVCEGGAEFASGLLAESLVDELCLTTSPLLTSQGLAPFDVRSARELQLAQLLVDDAGSLFARWTM